MPLTAGTTIGEQYRWRKGQSGNLSGRAKADFCLAEAARTHTPEMLAILVSIARDETAAPEDRIRAAQLVIERGHGKPIQALAIDQRVEHFDATQAFVEALKEYATEATGVKALPAE